MKKAVVVALVVLVIQACSKSNAPSEAGESDTSSPASVGSVPSTSDVERSLKAAFQECANLSVENVKVVNGMEVDDRTHQVQAQFDVRVVPLPDAKVQEVQQQQAAYDEALRGVTEHMEEAKKEADEVAEQRKELDNQVATELAARGGTGTAYQGPGSAVFDNLRAEHGGKDLDDKLNYLRGQINNPPGQSSGPRPGFVDAWGGFECLHKAKVPQDPAGSSTIAVNAVTKGVVNSLQVQLTMLKTDNGWMAAQ